MITNLPVPASAAVSSLRERSSLDSGWRFHLESTPTEFPTDPASPIFSDKAWRIVHVPHDYVVEGTFTPTADAGHGSLPVEPAWYRKTFVLPAGDRGKAVWLDFDGVFRDSVVYLNGHKLGEHPSGYTGFSYDIGKFANFGGSNTLAVHVDPTQREGWWYEGGGIYRHVWLNVASLVHVVPMGTYVTTKYASSKADITIQTSVASSQLPGARATGKLISRIYAPDGKEVAEASSPISLQGKPITSTQTAFVKQAALWSLDIPQLYRLHTIVQVSGATVDETDTSFGIRTIRFDADHGFFLNGKHVEIQGMCNHQDFAGVGIGLPDSLLYWRVKRLKAMGCNALRMAHNPPPAELLDACDKLGMLVMDENRHLGDTQLPKSPAGTTFSDLSDLGWMVQHDRNHPSVIMWSMCNEEPLEAGAEGAKIFTAMKDVVHQYDTTRPVTCAMNYGWGQGISLVEDLMGFNYFNSPADYDTYHQAHPAIPVYASETSSGTSDRGVYVDDKVKAYVNQFDMRPWYPDANTAEQAWQPVISRPYMAGSFVWTGFDYKGEPTPYGWPDINSHFGSLDMAGFPKAEYYYYQSVWTTKPMVHIVGPWNWEGSEGKPINIWCYSNAARVELFLNNRSLGSKVVPTASHVTWSVPYAPGTLLARGYDVAGHTIAQDTVQTASSPVKLQLSADRTLLTTDGEDAVVVSVAVLDQKGRIEPSAGNRVTFQISGPGQIAGVGNGDPADHDPDKATSRLAFHGLCIAIVQAEEKTGTIRLTATSPGIAPAVLSIQTK